MQFEHLMIHMLNPERGKLTMSDQVIDSMSEEAMAAVENKIDVAFMTNRKRNSSYIPNEFIRETINSYKNKEIEFKDVARKLTQTIYDKKVQHGLGDESDIVTAEALIDERRFLIISENSYVRQITHHIDQSEESTEILYVQSEGMVSSNLLKRDAVILIELSDMSVIVVEDRVIIDGHKIGFYGDMLFELEKQNSLADANKIYKAALLDVTKANKIDSVPLLPRLKQVIKEHVEDEEDLETATLATAVLEKYPEAKEAFIQKTKDAGVDDSISTAHTKLVKMDKVVKFTSDKGIEISIPVHMVNDPLYVDIEHDENYDSYTIVLKNIMKMKQR